MRSCGLLLQFGCANANARNNVLKETGRSVKVVAVNQKSPLLKVLKSQLTGSEV